MKFSELWLRELIGSNLDKENFSDQITMAGLEVDNIEPVAGVFQGVVVGEIIECNQHPKNDKLSITKVNIGNDRLLDIVCKASNCRQGMKTAVATTGATLPGNFKIKIIKIHGEISEGILCSYSKLGISIDQNSIIELPEDAPIGIDIRDYLKLNDNIIEINVTPNRADCLSVIGIARDLAALNKAELNMPDISPVSPTINDILPINVEAFNACPRYLGRIIKDINAKAPTPLWMKERLRRCGINPVDAIVDISNYVLLELGQPINFFDKDYIKGRILVRTAKEGEVLFLADGSKLKLKSDTLVIEDFEKALMVGGVFIGKNININNNTQNVVIECVSFNPAFITDHIHDHSLYNNAHYCYERGIDPAIQQKAMERATRLLIDICGGKVGPIINVVNETSLPKQVTITLRRSRLDKLIGHHIDSIQVSDILRRLGCELIEDQDQWQAKVPSWRFDMKIEEDLIEEISRVYGYDNIPEKPVLTSLLTNNYRKTDLLLKRVKALLNDKGYQEVITYTFVDPKVQRLIHPNEEALILPSPISNEMSAMRLSLWTGLIETIVYNQKRQQSRIRIFEIGLSFIPDTQSVLNVCQDTMIAGAICGNRYEEHWDIEKNTVDFYDMKGDLESILDLTGKLHEVEFRAEIIPALHPGQSAAVYQKKEHIGFIGVIHPELENKLGLHSTTIVFELKWNKILEHVTPKIQNIPRFPANRRDISIVVDENVPAADILIECKKVNSNQIVGVNLFDVYRGKDIKEGFKSLSISLIIQDNDRTLEREEIAATVTKCIETLKEKFQASLRNCNL